VNPPDTVSLPSKLELRAGKPPRGRNLAPLPTHSLLLSLYPRPHLKLKHHQIDPNIAVKEKEPSEIIEAIDLTLHKLKTTKIAASRGPCTKATEASR
jgi:hypothetical protein